MKYILMTILWLHSGYAFAEARVDAFYEPYNALLNQYVVAGQKNGISLNVVDYQMWGNDKLHYKAMKLLKESTPQVLKDKDKLAYWINAYNLLTVDLIIQEQEVESIKNLGSIFSTPWRKYDWRIAGEYYTLDKIEHQILRKMNEPRIHMAIVCASVSCPDLRAEVYTPQKIEQQLGNQTALFLKNIKKGALLQKDGAVVLSPIFKWFSEDFNQGGVLRFVSQYRADIKADAGIGGYFNYDWDLNSISADGGQQK